MEEGGHLGTQFGKCNSNLSNYNQFSFPVRFQHGNHEYLESYSCSLHCPAIQSEPYIANYKSVLEQQSSLLGVVVIFVYS